MIRLLIRRCSIALRHLWRPATTALGRPTISPAAGRTSQVRGSRHIPIHRVRRRPVGALAARPRPNLRRPIHLGVRTRRPRPALWIATRTVRSSKAPPVTKRASDGSKDMASSGALTAGLRPTRRPESVRTGNRSSRRYRRKINRKRMRRSCLRSTGVSLSIIDQRSRPAP